MCWKMIFYFPLKSHLNECITHDFPFQSIDVTLEMLNRLSIAWLMGNWSGNSRQLTTNGQSPHQKFTVCQKPWITISILFKNLVFQYNCGVCNTRKSHLQFAQFSSRIPDNKFRIEVFQTIYQSKNKKLKIDDEFFLWSFMCHAIWSFFCDVVIFRQHFLVDP